MCACTPLTVLYRLLVVWTLDQTRIVVHPSASLLAAMSFSAQLQLSYLWLHRHLELDPAPALLSSLANEGVMWLSVGGCVGFLTEEQDAKNFSSTVLLSEHLVLSKDHRKLLLRHEKGADDRVSNRCSPCSVPVSTRL